MLALIRNGSGKLRTVKALILNPHNHQAVITNAVC